VQCSLPYCTVHSAVLTWWWHRRTQWFYTILTKVHLDVTLCSVLTLCAKI